MIAIIDYGVGNLFSLKSSLAAIGREAVVTGDRAVLRAASHVILPGVGAFGDAAARLRAAGMAEAVLEAAAAGKPVLGICLGMQLLLERSFEYGGAPPAWASFRGGAPHPGRDSGGAGRAPHGLERPPLPGGRPRSPIFAALEEGGARLFRPLLRGLCLRRGAHRLDRVRRASDGGGAERKRVRHPVPPGEERGCGTADSQGILRIGGLKHDSASGY